MNVFQTAPETYHHLRVAHGDAGMAEAQVGYVIGGAWNADFIAGQAEALARIERERLVRGQFLGRQNAGAHPFVPRYHGYLLDEQLRARERAEAEQAEQARRIRDAMERDRVVREAEQAWQLEEAARARQAQAEEDRGWCILM